MRDMVYMALIVTLGMIVTADAEVPSIATFGGTPSEYSADNSLDIDTPVCCERDDQFLKIGMTEVRIAFHWNISTLSDGSPHNAQLMFVRGGQLIGTYTEIVKHPLGLGSFAVTLPQAITQADLDQQQSWQLYVFIVRGVSETATMLFSDRLTSDSHVYFGVTESPTPAPTPLPSTRLPTVSPTDTIIERVPVTTTGAPIFRNDVTPGAKLPDTTSTPQSEGGADNGAGDENRVGKGDGAKSSKGGKHSSKGGKHNTLTGARLKVAKLVQAGQTTVPDGVQSSKNFAAFSVAAVMAVAGVVAAVKFGRREPVPVRKIAEHPFSVAMRNYGTTSHENNLEHTDVIRFVMAEPDRVSFDNLDVM